MLDEFIIFQIYVYICINHTFYFLYFIMLTSWRSYRPGRDCPLEGQLIPKDSKQSAQQPAFHMQTNQSKTIFPSIIYLTFIYQAIISRALGQPRARKQAIRDQPYTQNPARIIQTLQSYWFTLPCLAFLMETTRKALSMFFHSSLPSDQHCVCGCALGNCK